MRPLLPQVADDEARLTRLLETYRSVAGRPDAAAEAQALAAQLVLEVGAYALALRQAVYPALPAAVAGADPGVGEGLHACEALAARAAAPDLPVPVRDGLVGALAAMRARQAAYPVQKLWPLLPPARRRALASAYQEAVETARAGWARLRARGEVEDEDADPVG